MKFSKYIDNGKSVICPSQLPGRTFLLEISGSDPSYCWFGAKNCFNGSRTISQKATIIPSYLGTWRKSPMSFTVIMTECSHVNNTEFLRRSPGNIYISSEIVLYVRLWFCRDPRGRIVSNGEQVCASISNLQPRRRRRLDSPKPS
jgi:hypothetical protein